MNKKTKENKRKSEKTRGKEIYKDVNSVARENQKT